MFSGRIFPLKWKIIKPDFFRDKYRLYFVISYCTEEHSDFELKEYDSEFKISTCFRLLNQKEEQSIKLNRIKTFKNNNIQVSVRSENVQEQILARDFTQLNKII